ncbi:MAG: methyltransferase [Ferruginibacter sp.]|nr:methyltransferase [Ferruginibacter sp.]
MELPSALISSLTNVKGFNKEAFEKVHQSGEQNTSIRINIHKLPDALKADLTGIAFEDVAISPVPWSSNGYYLSARPSFTSDPLFHGGAYYVQEASSMFLEEALKQSVDLTQPLKVLDLCAAPGGKSTLIQSLLSATSLLVSNEVIKSRVMILAENITKWGSSNVIVTNNDPADFKRLPGFFDIIVVDAPCSGSGLFRKDPKATEEWSGQNVEQCCVRQQKILADILPSLKEGGVLIYSTCSYSTEEDEAIADMVMKEHPLSTIRLSLKEEWNIVETTAADSNAFGYRFYPDQLKGEGFYIAAFKKNIAGDIIPQNNKKKIRTEVLTPKEISVIKTWLKNPDDFFFINQQEEVIAMPAHLENDLTDIRSALYIKKAGVKMGTIIRNELIPAHELALSSIIHHRIPSVKVDKATALQYLRRGEIKIDSHNKGWAMLTHHHLALGWIKILPNRINNYYPKEWRILNK